MTFSPYIFSEISWLEQRGDVEPVQKYGSGVW